VLTVKIITPLYFRMMFYMSTLEIVLIKNIIKNTNEYLFLIIKCRCRIE
jgi:hypothetical protein